MTSIADSTMFKVVVPVLQTIISLAAVGAFTYVVSSLSSIQVQLASYQTSSALIAQRVDSLERSRESTEKFVDGLRSDTQRQGFLIMQNTEALKNLVLTGRPK
jgi:hypothetical protein